MGSRSSGGWLGFSPRAAAASLREGPTAPPCTRARLRARVNTQSPFAERQTCQRARPADMATCAASRPDQAAGHLWSALARKWSASFWFRRCTGTCLLLLALPNQLTFPCNVARALPALVLYCQGPLFSYLDACNFCARRGRGQVNHVIPFRIKHARTESCRVN
jgi:hypothetical protein